MAKRQYKLVVRSPITREITRLLKAHPELSLLEIATSMGLASPGVLTMFQQGRTRMPLKQVVPLCQALGEDHRKLLNLVFTDHYPTVAAYMKAK